MRERGKFFKLILFISVIVIICVGITVIITSRMVSDVPENKAKSKAVIKVNRQQDVISELEDRVYDNAEIISCSDGVIQYKWNGKKYQCAGELEKKYLGTADIEVEKHQIVKVKVKSQITVPERTVSVLLKNGSSNFYKSVWMSGDSDLYINGQCVKKKQLDVSKYMKKHKKTNVVVRVKTGKIRYGLSKSKCKPQGYEGLFYIIKDDGGYVVVNEIGVENYLRYLLPSEMLSSFSMEALKAQAVCARTFAYVQMNKVSEYERYGASLDDTVAYQVYNSGGTTERTDQAVRETKGKVLTCFGQLVECYYFSTSAGMTENMEVWGSTTPAYIKSVESKDTLSPYYSWNADINLKKYKDPEYGKLKKITVNSTSSRGYVLSLTATYEKGTLTYTKENDIRKFMGKYLKSITLQNGTIRKDLSMLPSACFTIVNKKKSLYQITGGGYGHDIGLSQYGAEMLARTGVTYDKILQHYYANIKIETMQ